MFPRLIETPHGPQQQIVTIRNRPVRVGFVVNRNIDPNTFNELILYNCQLWGGIYNAFVPTDGSSIREDWWRLLYFHDPDILYCVGQIEPELSLELYKKLQPFNIFAWSEDMFKALSEDSLKTKVVTVRALYAYQYRMKVTAEDALDFRYPIFEGEPYSRFLKFIHGSYPDEIQ